jgi:hypothetical protein
VQQTQVLDVAHAQIGALTPPKTARKARCEDCFFHQNMLCALEDKKPCPTFRPAHPDGLRPPRQLSFVFRQGRAADPFAFDTPYA